MKLRSSAVWPVLVAAMSICIWSAFPSTVAAEEVRIAGSTTFAPMAQALADSFKVKNPAFKVIFTEMNATESIDAVIEGNVEIGCSARYIRPTESDKALKKGPGLVCRSFALDAIVPVVHPSNKTKSVGLGQLKDIYSGKISNWNFFTEGADVPIKVVKRESGSAMDEFWSEKVMSGDPALSGAITWKSNPDVIKAVSEDPSAIGYTNFGRVTSQLRILSVNGIDMSGPPNEFHPFSRKLLMCTSGKLSGAAQQFLDFVDSPEGKSVIRRVGFIPL